MSYGSKSVRALYYSLPLAAKNLLASTYGWRERRRRYGQTYQETLALLRDSQGWSNEELLAVQQARLSQFLPEAVSHTRYFRSQTRYADLLKANAPLADFPLLSKATVRSEATNFHHDEIASMHCRWISTSGTTGSPLVLPVSDQHFQRECAFRALAYEWAGVGLETDKVAFCAGHPVARADRTRPPFWVYDWSSNWLYFSSYHLSRQNLQHYILELEKFQPVMLGGYPSALYLLALGYEKFGGKLKLKAISCSSETLFPWQRAKIAGVFGAKVFNYYGSGETAANIAECEAGELHLKLEHSAVEVLNERNEQCAPGETGRLVSTGFDNLAFPLIRYEIGDEVTISKDQTAKCGRGGLLLDQILGRAEDYVLTPEGRILGRLDHLFKDCRNVVEAQLYQARVEELVCRIVKTDDYSEADEQAIRAEARMRLGPALKIDFEYVARLPRTKGGKLRFVVSEIDQTKMPDLLR